jgi:AAA15 family ATPase/GTPase
MLRSFTASNFKSFDSPQTLSLSASRITRHPDHVREVSGRKVLRTALIFGANAGGKSNLVKAINFSRDLILSGIDNVNLTNQYFRINSENYHKPGTFEYDLLINGHEYLYGISLSYEHQEILTERLVRIQKSGRKFVIFNRVTAEDKSSNVQTDITASGKSEVTRLHVYFDDFGAEISDSFRKKTMLSDIASRSNTHQGILGEILHVFEDLQNMIIIFPNSKYNLINEIGSDDTRRDLFQNIMKDFDTGIEAISSQLHSMDFNKLFADMPSKEADELRLTLSKAAGEHPVTFRAGNQVIILRKNSSGEIIYNKLLLDHGNPEDLFDYQDESDGTKRLFDLVPLLYDTEKRSTIIIDEIDRSLHTNLVRKFIELFYEKTSDSESQLIATTQDPNIMDLDLLRQDEIWFVQREPDHSTYMYSLNKYNARFDKVVRNDYIAGRYGAVPRLSDSFRL